MQGKQMSVGTLQFIPTVARRWRTPFVGEQTTDKSVRLAGYSYFKRVKKFISLSTSLRSASC